MTSKNLLSDPSVMTPCLLVDRGRLENNLKRLKDRIAGSGVSVRPHLKTVKSIEAARLALGDESTGATVSTLKEAEEFGSRGITDLLYAVCISPQKLQRVTSLRQDGVDLKIVIDSAEMAEVVSAHASRTADRIPTLIELDVDGHRSGVGSEETDLLVRIGRILDEGGAELRGVMTHAGGSYAYQTPAELEAAAEAEQRGAVRMANALAEAGLPCPVVSIGSTPTAFSASSWDGITELRAGVYMFFDLFQAGVGVCSVSDIALSVLATVIGHQKEKNWVIVDAGWTALSADRSTRQQSVDQYFGLVCDLDCNPYPDVLVVRVSQEHGIIAPRPGSGGPLPALKIGDRVRILPNHACATATQHSEYAVIDDSGAIQETWQRFHGW